MKQERGMLTDACTPMAGLSPVSANSLAQHPFPTPSPFSFSIASTGWSSRLYINVYSLTLRFLALIFSFVSALLLATPSKKNGHQPSGFIKHSELLYLFIVCILVFIYSAFQLLKGVCDIAHRGILISDMISDYVSFIFDHLLGYLLISSCSAAATAIQDIEKAAAPWKVAVISIGTSFTTFLIFATCTLLSGYKLCKRIIW